MIVFAASNIYDEVRAMFPNCLCFCCSGLLDDQVIIIGG